MPAASSADATTATPPALTHSPPEGCAVCDAFSEIVDDAMVNDDFEWPVHLTRRLRAAVKRWELIATPTVVRWVRDGLDLIWSDAGPPPRYHCQRNGKGASQYAAQLRKTLAEMETLGIIRKCDSAPHLVMPINLIAKSTPGKFRFLLDARRLNEPHLRPWSMRMETIATHRLLFAKGAFMTTTDLVKGYYHVRIADTFAKYLGFNFEGTYYEHVAMPMGLSTSASAFTKVVRQLVRVWREQNIVRIHYLDDLCCLGFADKPHSAANTAAATKIMTDDLAKFGFLVNFDKSQHVPSQIVDFIGFTMDTTETPTIAVKQSRKTKTSKLLAELIDAHEHNQTVFVRDLASVAGMLMSMSLAVGPVVQRRTRAVFEAIERRSHWNARVSVLDHEANELRYWQEMIPALQPIMLNPAAIDDCRPMILRCDASEAAVGGWLAERNIAHHDSSSYAQLAGANSAEEAEKIMRAGEAIIVWELMAPHVAFNPDGSPTASTFREVWGILHSLMSTAKYARGRALIVYCDNQAACSILTKGSKKRYINDLVTKAHVLLASLGIAAEFRWLRRNKMEGSDMISKWSGEYRLSTPSFEELQRRYGTPFTADLFASETAHQSSIPFFGPATSPSCPITMVNAFDQEWPIDAFAFPPPHLVSRTIAHLRARAASAAVIVPDDASYAWTPLLQPDAPGVKWSSKLRTHEISWHGVNRRHHGRTWRCVAVDYRQPTADARPPTPPPPPPPRPPSSTPDRR